MQLRYTMDIHLTKLFWPDQIYYAALLDFFSDFGSTRLQ